MTRFRETARSGGHPALMCDVGATVGHVWRQNLELTFEWN